MFEIDESRKQVAEQNVQRNKCMIAAVILFVLCVLSTFLFNIIPTWMALALVCIFAIGTLVCTVKIPDTTKTEKLIVERNLTPVNLDAIRKNLPQTAKIYNKNGEDTRENGEDTPLEVFIMDSAINKKFITMSLWAKIQSEPYALPASVLPYTSYIRAERNKEIAHYTATRPDKVVIGLASDITLDMFNQKRPSVDVRKATRFAVQTTDDAFNIVIENKKIKNGDTIVFDGRELALREDGALLPFIDSKIVNEIDIHSLIISSDGYVLFMRGTDKHPLRPGKIISSAACSLLPGEIDDRPIQESMIDSIHAKIRIIYDIPENTMIKSSLCGFARILKRCGAPEFYVLTRIGLPKDQLVASHKDPTSEFEDSLLKQNVPELDTVENTASYLCNGITAIRDASTDDTISLSASAMLTAVDLAMHDERSARKILKRIGAVSD